MAINNAGTVVGSSEDMLGVNFAFVWTKVGGMRPLFPARPSTWATGINEHGDVVAYGHRRAYLVSGGNTTVLPVRFPNGSSYVTDINDVGEIVGGDYKYQGKFPFPTIWIKGESYGLPGSSTTYPAAINNKGQIAGQVGSPWVLGRPVTWINRQILHLPMLAFGGEANDVDESGLIVGYLLDESYGSHAVVWRNTVSSPGEHSARVVPIRS